MTQIVVHQSSHGIVLATDSRAVSFDSGESTRCLAVQKLFQLTPHMVVVTGGAGYGIPLCEHFKAYIAHAGLSQMEPIVHAALTFFDAAVQQVRNDRGADTPVDPELDRVYFVLAGLQEGNSVEPYQFVMLGSEHPHDAVHVITTTHVAAIPRNLRIEYTLSQPAAAELDADGVEALLESFYVKLARSGDDVGPPFHFVRIGRDGVRVRTRTDLDSTA